MDKKKRPSILEGTTTKIETGCGNIYVSVNTSPPGEVFEVFASLGKNGGCSNAQLEALTRTITIGLRYGVPVEAYVEHLQEIKCQAPSWDEGNKVCSCPDAIALVLRNFCKEKK